MMQARARIRFLKMSPRKMRQVADLIKGKPVQEALNILNYTPKSAAHPLAKTVKAAAANAIAGVGTAKLKAEDLSISKILIDGAPTAKRIRFQSMGRVFRIRKRYCHVMVEVEGEPEPIKERTAAAKTKKDKAEKEPPTAKEGKAKSKAKGKADAEPEVDDKTEAAPVEKAAEEEDK
ncbi:MAG: 50S ribosomal protein L22 [bacterium]